MNQKRDSQGRFSERKKIENGTVAFLLTEYQCRIIGNRLRRAAQRYNDLHNSVDCRLHQDCEYWSEKFATKAKTRDEYDKECHENGSKRHTTPQKKVKVTLTEYECWSVGNRLFETGQWFEEKGYDSIAQETKWLARKFHAEKKGSDNND